MGPCAEKLNLCAFRLGAFVPCVAVPKWWIVEEKEKELRRRWNFQSLYIWRRRSNLGAVKPSTAERKGRINEDQAVGRLACPPVCLLKALERAFQVL